MWIRSVVRMVVPCVIAACSLATLASAAAEPPSAQGTRLVDTFDAAWAAARRGDPSAASALFRASRECIRVRRNDHLRALLANVPDLANHPAGEAYRQRIERWRPMCEGSELKVTEGSMYDIALTAARLGDIDAAACFVAAPWGDSRVDRSKRGAYRAAFDEIVEQALPRGDWRFVQAMVSASSTIMSTGYAAMIHHPDAAQLLRYMKLLRLGAIPGSAYATELDVSIDIVADQLQPQVITDADAWADGMFRRYYIAQPQPQDMATRTGCDS